MPKQNFPKKDPKLAREAKKYAEPIASREYIMSFMAHKKKPLTYVAIERQCAPKNKQTKIALERRIKAMLRDGQIIRDQAQKFVLVDSLKRKKGVITFTKEHGLVFVSEAQEQIALSPKSDYLYFDGDVVMAHIAPEQQFGKRIAMPVEVLSRKHTTVTGLYRHRAGMGYIDVALKRFRVDVMVAPDGVHAEDRQYVIADIIQYPSVKQAYCVARITQVLGDTTTPGIELAVALSAHTIPHTWPDSVYEAVAALPEDACDDDPRRIDLTALPFVTIDGEDSRDFDDAVYAKCLPSGGYCLYVAIADVSYYVAPGSALDQVAQERGTSVYFPREVVPMLPEALSNHLCSLVPKQKRLALVAKIQFDADGVVFSYEFFRAMIYSHARLTYHKTYAMLTGEMDVPEWLQQPLQTLDRIYDVLTKCRIKRQAVVFDTEESKAIFNKAGRIERIVPVRRNRAHKIIEECMLLANETAARFLSKHDCPTLYRVHEAPDASRVAQLEGLLRIFPLNIRIDKQLTAETINQIIAACSGKDYAKIVQIAILRSMQQAVYQTDNIGHYGLAYTHYLHFTSPIRRYPDLVVHRCIIHILQQGDRKKACYKPTDLVRLGAHCSMVEKRADYASRDVMAWLKCCFMQQHIGAKFEGIITSVTNFGLFVEIPHLAIDGLVHISLLSGDYYHFDQTTQVLIGERSGKRFQIGMLVTICVERADIIDKQIDFSLVN